MSELKEKKIEREMLKVTRKRLMNCLLSDNLIPIMRENTQIQIKEISQKIRSLNVNCLEEYEKEVGEYVAKYYRIEEPVFNFFTKKYEKTDNIEISITLTRKIKSISEKYVSLPEIIEISDRVICECGCDLTPFCSSSSDIIECPTCQISRYACSAKLAVKRESKSEMQKYLSRFGGSGMDNISDELIEQIKGSLITETPTHQEIYSVLSKLHKTEYSKDVNSILHKISGNSLPNIRYLNSKFLDYHTKIRTAYGRINKRRKSHLGIEYQAYMIFGMLGSPFHISYFKIIKNELREYDDLFGRSCKETGDKSLLNAYNIWSNNRKKYEKDEPDILRIKSTYNGTCRNFGKSETISSDLGSN